MTRPARAPRWYFRAAGWYTSLIGHADGRMFRSGMTNHLIDHLRTSRYSARMLVHNTSREGLQLGATVAIITWLWIAALDALAGTPFQTMHALGGTAFFSIVHVGLCLAYGIVIVATVHAAMRAPSLIFAMIFCTILFQAAFAMFTSVLGQLGAGSGTWLRFFAGNVLAAVVTYVTLARTHPLKSILDRAEAER